MTALQKFWLVDTTGTKALVEGDDERDRFLPLGWALCDPPVGGEFVVVRHAGIAAPGKLAADTLDAWAAKEWAPGAPAHPLDGLAAPVAAPAADKPTKTTAAGGTVKGS